MDIQQIYDQHQAFMVEIIHKIGYQKFFKSFDNPGQHNQYKNHSMFGENNFTVVPHFGGWENPPHRHEFFEFVYVHRGSCINLVDSVPVRMSAGDICLLNTNALHTIQISNPQVDTVFNLLICRSMMDSFHFKVFSSNDFVTGFFLRSIQKQREEKNYILFPYSSGRSEPASLLCKIIEEFYKDESYKNTKIISLFDCLMIELIRSHQKDVDDQNRATRENQHVSDIVKYIVANSATVSLKTLAERFNYNPKHLSKLIKQHSGSSFQEFLTDTRLKQAGFLLRESDQTITDIMNAVGYFNRTWFNKMFGEKYGMSPSDYRSKNIQKN